MEIFDFHFHLGTASLKSVEPRLAVQEVLDAQALFCEGSH